MSEVFKTTAEQRAKIGDIYTQMLDSGVRLVHAIFCREYAYDYSNVYERMVLWSTADSSEKRLILTSMLESIRDIEKETWVNYTRRLADQR